MTQFPDHRMPEFGVPSSRDAMVHEAEIRDSIERAKVSDPNDLTNLLAEDNPVLRREAKQQLIDANSDLIGYREMRCEMFSRFIADIPRLLQE